MSSQMARTEQRIKLLKSISKKAQITALENVARRTADYAYRIAQEDLRKQRRRRKGITKLPTVSQFVKRDTSNKARTIGGIWMDIVGFRYQWQRPLRKFLERRSIDAFNELNTAIRFPLIPINIRAKLLFVRELADEIASPAYKLRTGKDAPGNRGIDAIVNFYHQEQFYISAEPDIRFDVDQDIFGDYAFVEMKIGIDWKGVKYQDPGEIKRKVNIFMLDAWREEKAKLHKEMRNQWALR